MTVQQLSENEFKLMSPEHSRKSLSTSDMIDTRAKTIVLEMEKFKVMDDQWFKLYEYAN